MKKTTKPLLSLTAGDLMSGPVLAIPRAMSLRGAAHLLSQATISGAPVVDDDGRCIGVISSTDFVAWADKGERASKVHPQACGCVHSAWEVHDLEQVPNDQVGEYMTADPVTVPPDMEIIELARIMRDVHIHRVIVVDNDGRPIGVVSSTDILAAVAHAQKPEAQETTPLLRAPHFV
jgi:predicted transcriptional regulator